MDAEKLKEIIRNGESSTLEFKETLTDKLPIEKEIVAFLNLRGGKILIGVSDNKVIVGVDEKELKNIEEKIMNKCRSVVKPEIIPIYETIFVDGKYVIVLEVRGINKPYYVFKDNRKTYYIRVGTTEREATREELGRLFQALGMIYYEENPVYNSSIKDLSMDKITEYFEKLRGVMFENLPEEEKINILINSKILTNRDDKILCTVSGILLFGKEPTKLLSQSGIIYEYFEGNEISGHLIDRKELNGTIVENIINICKIIKLNLQRSSKIEGLERVEKEEIPERVIRETIANACIHRDYTIYGAKIRAFMFDDRLEIRSPGVPPNTVNVESMKTGISVYRNPIIVRFINDYHLAEGMGRGIPMIIKEMNKISGKEPKIEVLENETNLIIYFPKRK